MVQYGPVLALFTVCESLPLGIITDIMPRQLVWVTGLDSTKRCILKYEIQ